MNKGQIVALGTPREVLRAECIRSVFGVEVDVEYYGVRGCHIRYRAPGHEQLHLKQSA
jgi:iron complex transport system ATP-binding protein